MTPEELRRLDQRHVWHPFTPHAVYPDDRPLMIVEAEGHWLIDADGTRYLDGVASLWCKALYQNISVIKNKSPASKSIPSSRKFGTQGANNSNIKLKMLQIPT